MIGALAKYVPEQRAVYQAEQRLDRAEHELIATYEPAKACKRWGARARYQQALIELQSAIARLQKRKCELAGRRHLRIASPLSRDHQQETRDES